MAHGRAKRPHQKVKTGCMTCRKRRIKCDEAKPACRQCTDSLRQCEGYQPPQTWLFKSRKETGQTETANTDPIKTAVDNSTTTSLGTVIVPWGQFDDGKERRSFQFWHEKAAPMFSSYFGHSFWSETLPQIGVAQPAIKHLLVATSSLVEISALAGVPLEKNLLYQTHFTKAVQATCSSPDVESVLMACLLFACGEFMKGSVAGGLSHIHAGLKIINEWAKAKGKVDLEETGSETERLIVRTIGPIFLAYIDKVPTYGQGDVMVSECACTTLIKSRNELPFIGTFKDIHIAYHSLDGIAHHIAKLMDFRRPSWTPSSPEAVKPLLATWLAAFEAFEMDMPALQKQQLTPTFQLMRVYHAMLKIMLRACSSKNEEIYEQSAEDFRWIVGRFDAFAELWSQGDITKFFVGGGNLDYHMGFIPPLFLTATKCRDPATRMAALRHLASLRVSEANWTSCTAYVVARKIIQVENQRCVQSKSKSKSKKQERDLIRPVEVLMTDHRQTQGGLDYVTYPYDSSPVQRATFDLRHCPNSPSAHWPLSRMIRIGGFQGGGVLSSSIDCTCGFRPAKKPR